MNSQSNPREELEKELEEILYAFSNYWRENAHDTMPPGEYLTATQAKNSLLALIEAETNRKVEEVEMKYQDLVLDEMIDLLKSVTPARPEDLTQSQWYGLVEALNVTRKVFEQGILALQSKRSDYHCLVCGDQKADHPSENCPERIQL